MSIYNKFNSRNINDRQVDTLIGLSKGLIADGKLVQEEVEFLFTWLVQNDFSNNPVVRKVLERVELALEDGVLDKKESDDLFNLLTELGGEISELGELSKTSTLPTCKPQPSVSFEGKTFLLTGKFSFGTRKECEDKISELGGFTAGRVTKKVDFVVLGTYVSESWAHESYGRKIEKAMTYREDGVPLSIITEEHWSKFIDL